MQDPQLPGGFLLLRILPTTFVTTSTALQTFETTTDDAVIIHRFNQDLALRILFLHEVNYLKKPIFEMHEFPEHLAALGHTVGFVQFPEGESRASLARTPFKQQIQGRVLISQSITLYTPETLSGIFLGRLLAVFTFKSVFKKVVHDFEPDVVVSLSVPTSGWQAVQVCKKLGVPLVFRALDVSHKIRKSALSPLIRLAEQYIYKNADWVSANNPAMLEYIRDAGARSESSGINFPPLDLRHFADAKKAKREIREKLSIPLDANVVVYMGSFFYFSGLPEVIKSFAEIANNNDRLVLIGGGEQDHELRELSKALGVQSQIIFTGMVSYSDLPKHLGVADVAINPLNPSVVASTALPNKVLQYMASGLAVVSTKLRGLVQTFETSLPGLQFVEHPKDLLVTALKVGADTAANSSVGEGNKKAVAELFDKDLAINSFEKSLLMVAGEKT
jgi:glycosyltransferase involved in cell wall biosynthesis